MEISVSAALIPVFTYSFAYLKSLRQEGEPINLKSVSKTENGMLLLIAHKEVQLRERTQLILVSIINTFKIYHLLRHKKMAFRHSSHR